MPTFTIDLHLLEHENLAYVFAIKIHSMKFCLEFTCGG